MVMVVVMATSVNNRGWGVYLKEASCESGINILTYTRYSHNFGIRMFTCPNPTLLIQPYIGRIHC